MANDHGGLRVTGDHTRSNFALHVAAVDDAALALLAVLVGRCGLWIMDYGLWIVDVDLRC
jgi:hypothetical protein